MQANILLYDRRASGLRIFPASGPCAERKIRVGYYEDGDYMSLNENGEYAGFNIEYLEKNCPVYGLGIRNSRLPELGQYAANAEGWENRPASAVYYTEERARELLLSNLKMCDIYSTLNVRADDDRYHYEDFESFGGMKVGVIKK